MRISKYSPMLALLVGALVIAGAGCLGDTTTNSNTGTTVTNDDATVNDELILGNEDETVGDEVDVEEDVDADTDEDTAMTDGASIEIVEPVDGDTVASTFDLVVDVADFTLAPDKVEGENAEGEGHYHVWVDGEYYAPGLSDTTTLTDLEPGEHELMVSLQNNDHTDLTEAVKSEPVTVTVAAE